MLIFVAQFKVLPGIGEPNISNFSADFVANFGPDYSPQACSCKRSYFADASPIFFPKFAQIISIFSESTINLHANYMISRRLPITIQRREAMPLCVRRQFKRRQARGVRFWLRYQKSVRKLWWHG
jgi:hypothetical protein